jgi:hypothetical protein
MSRILGLKFLVFEARICQDLRNSKLKKGIPNCGRVVHICNQGFERMG